MFTFAHIRSFQPHSFFLINMTLSPGIDSLTMHSVLHGSSTVLKPTKLLTRQLWELQGCSACVALQACCYNATCKYSQLLRNPHRWVQSCRG